MPAHAFKNNPVYILDAVRSPIASPFKSLRDLTSAQIGAAVLAGLLRRVNVQPADVAEVMMGEAVLAGGGQNPARQAALMAGLSPATTAMTINQVCAGGLQAVILASRAILENPSAIIVAGGMESATRTLHYFSKLSEEPFAQRDPVDGLIYDGLWCVLSGQHMGQLCEALAQKEKMTRQAQDVYAMESHRRAQAATSAGHFSKQIIPLVVSEGKVFSTDERLRHMTEESFRMLPPVFHPTGTITSGNASVPSDGAAAVLLTGQSGLADRVPVAKILGYASVGVAPQDTFSAAVVAIEQCLKACRVSLTDIDLWEVSEAFAAQAIYTQRTLKIPYEQMNVFGGDVALGHPLGAAGTRILVTLTHALKTLSLRRGLAVICYGGGGAVAVLVERYEA